MAEQIAHSAPSDDASVGYNQKGNVEAIWRKNSNGQWTQYVRSARKNEIWSERKVEPDQNISLHPDDPNYAPTPGWQ